MPAQLNIKDPILIERVRELAKNQGRPVTATLRALVDREWDAREARTAQALVDDRQWLAEWQAKVAFDMPRDVQGKSSKEIMDSLYDPDQPDGFAR